MIVIDLNAQNIPYSDTLVQSIHEGSRSEDAADAQKTNYFLNKSESSGRDDSFQLRQLPAAKLKALKNDNAFWYANANIKKKATEENEQGPFTGQKWFQTFLWLLIIGGFAAFILIYLANSNVRLFSRRNRSIREAMEEEMETDDIFAINYQKEIDKATKNGNYRLAVRLLFLRLLRKLSDKNIIQYKQGRTNFDYLLQLGSSPYYKDFFRITRNFEYSWYGQFEVSPETFDVIRKDVENFEKNIK